MTATQYNAVIRESDDGTFYMDTHQDEMPGYIERRTFDTWNDLAFFLVNHKDLGFVEVTDEMREEDVIDCDVLYTATRAA